MLQTSLTLINPYACVPTTSGGKNRTRYTLTELVKYYAVNVIFFYEHSNERHTTGDFLQTLHIPSYFFGTHSRSIWSFITRGLPYWFSGWYSVNLINYLKQLTKDSPTNILIEYTQLLYLINYIPAGYHSSFTAYDISTISFWRRLVTEPNYLKKFLGFFRWLEIYLYERAYLPQYDQVIAVSQVDARCLRRFFGCKHVNVIPNGIPGVHLLPPAHHNGYLKLGFIGSASHPPNAQAIKFVLDSITPVLRKRGIPFRLSIAGADPSYLQPAYSGLKELVCLPYLPDVAEFYRQIDILVAPIFSGSGSRIKILESLSFGRPVVTTPVGAEGIDLVTPYINIIPQTQAQSAPVWIERITSVQNQDFSSPALLAELKAKLDPYTWHNIFYTHQEIFRAKESNSGDTSGNWRRNPG